MSEPRKSILVTGATGQQGGQVVQALLNDPKTASSFQILAVTRNPTSPSAQRLSSQSPYLKIIQGDFTDCPALFASARAATNQPVWGVFSVTVPGKQEEAHGKALVDAALDAGVEHFVYTSVDRGGDEASWTNPTPIPHFISKHNVELYLREKVAATGNKMTWTILRPVAFMDNWKPGYGSNVFFTGLTQEMSPEKKLQWVSVKTIGVAGAKAFVDSSMRNKAVGLAGHECTNGQLQEIFRKEAGGKSPEVTWGVVGTMFRTFVGDIGTMIKWFGDVGYGVDVEGCRKKFGAETLDEWVSKSSWAGGQGK